MDSNDLNRIDNLGSQVNQRIDQLNQRFDSALKMILDRKQMFELYSERLNFELLFFDRITGLTRIVFRSRISCYPVKKSFVLTRLKYIQTKNLVDPER
jgi:hypothetical protein